MINDGKFQQYGEGSNRGADETKVDDETKAEAEAGSEVETKVDAGSEAEVVVPGDSQTVDDGVLDGQHHAIDGVAADDKQAIGVGTVGENIVSDDSGKETNNADVKPAESEVDAAEECDKSAGEPTADEQIENDRDVNDEQKTNDSDAAEEPKESNADAAEQPTNVNVEQADGKTKEHINDDKKANGKDETIDENDAETAEKQTNDPTHPAETTDSKTANNNDEQIDEHIDENTEEESRNSPTDKLVENSTNIVSDKTSIPLVQNPALEARVII